VTEQRLRFWVPIGVIAGCSLIAAILIAVRAPIESSEILDIAPRVRVLNVSQETVNLTVETHGTVTPRTESELIPEVSGPVTSVSPQLVSGGFFQKGDVLLEIDRRDYQTALDRAKAVRLRTRSEHARAKKELGRQEKLRASGAASQARFDDATNAAQIAAAALQEARALLEQAERDLERTRVLARFTGRVREENVGVGQFVNRGNSVAKLDATDFVEIRLPVPDQQLAFLDLQLAGVAASDQTGPKVKLHASFAGGEYTWEGRVHRTEGEIDPRTRTVTVVARVESPYDPSGGRPPLAVGLFVRAVIEGRELVGATVIPRSALHDRDRVWTVDADDRLRERAVQVLRTNHDEAILSGGLRSGERIVVSPLRMPVEGMRVKPMVAPDGMRP